MHIHSKRFEVMKSKDFLDASYMKVSSVKIKNRVKEFYILKKNGNLLVNSRLSKMAKIILNSKMISDLKAQFIL